VFQFVDETKMIPQAEVHRHWGEYQHLFCVGTPARPASRRGAASPTTRPQPSPANQPAGGGQSSPAAVGGAGGGRRGNSRGEAEAQDAPAQLYQAMRRLAGDAASPELESLQETFTTWASMEAAQREADREENSAFRAEMRGEWAARQQQIAEQVRSLAAIA